MGRRQQPIIAVSMGDAGGIGGEVLLKSWLHLQQKLKPPTLLLFDDPARVEWLIKFLRLPIKILQVVAGDMATIAQPSRDKNLLVVPIATKIDFHLGAPEGQRVARHAAAAMESLDRAVAMVKKNQADGLLTLPLDKSVIAESVKNFLGHTDYLAQQAGVKNHAMMLTATEHDGRVFRTIPLTTHIPLNKVANAITEKLLLDIVPLVAGELQKKFSIKQPRIALAGLNPHAGDGGIMGREEIDIMLPAVKKLQQQGFNISHPLSADSLFTSQHRYHYDVFLCPSHDQALIPIKTLFFERAVNITLGLPYIRVSPDHGTGFALADQNRADPSSTIAAIELVESIMAQQS